MRYLGGKARGGKQIAEQCLKVLAPGATFVEMFCGSLNVIRHVPPDVRRIAIDACGPLIVMWRAALAGWVPPVIVTAEEYALIKKTQDPHDPMTAFALFGCSFAGKWAGGYAKDPPTWSHARCASNSVVRKARDCAGLELEHNTFQQKKPGCWERGTVLYCDPPYANTTGYKAVEPFNSGAFWFWAEEHARYGVYVCVSEGVAVDPLPGWSVIDEQHGLPGRLNPGHKKRVDRLFFCEKYL
jgi:DNA adenine methylase